MEHGMIADKMKQDIPREEASNVSPEEQSLYSSIVSNAMKIIYGEKMANIVTMLKNAPNPSEGVAQATNMIGDILYAAAQKQGQDLPDDVLNAASEEINDLLFELGEKSGAFKEVTEDDRFKAQVRTYELWDKAHPGMMDKEGMQQSISGMDKSKLSEIVKQMGGDKWSE